MNTIKQLIQQYCPDGVEYRKLGEVCKVLRGKRLTKKELTEEGKYPVFHGGLEPIGYYSGNNRSANSVMIIDVGASAGTIGYSKVDFWSSDGCFCLSHIPELNQRFLYFYLQSCERTIKSKVRHAGIPTLDNREVENLSIPLPPLLVQHKIVEILDNFTELEAELEARKKQYTYYRDQLLNFDGRNDIKMVFLPEISENLDSKRKPIKSGLRQSGDYPYYGASGIVDYVDGFIFDGNYLLVSEDGANLLARSTKIAFSISGKNWVNNHAHVLQFDDSITRKFVEYYIEHLDISKYTRVRDKLMGKEFQLP